MVLGFFLKKKTENGVKCSGRESRDQPGLFLRFRSPCQDSGCVSAGRRRPETGGSRPKKGERARGVRAGKKGERLELWEGVCGRSCSRIVNRELANNGRTFILRDLKRSGRRSGKRRRATVFEPFTVSGTFDFLGGTVLHILRWHFCPSSVLYNPRRVFLSCLLVN